MTCKNALSICVTVTTTQKNLSKSPSNSVTLCVFPTSLDLVGILMLGPSILVVQIHLKWEYKNMFLLEFLLITPRMENISALSQRIRSPLAELLPKRKQQSITRDSIFSRVKLSIQPIEPKVVQYHCQTVQITRTPLRLSRFVPFCLSRTVPYFFLMVS